LETPFTPPSSDLEHELAAIWTDLLGISPIGIHDNYFDLGGDSLLTLRLLSQIETTFQQTISLSNLLLNPTIANITAQLDAQSTEELADAVAAETSRLDGQQQTIFDEIAQHTGIRTLRRQGFNPAPVRARLERILQLLPYGASTQILQWLVRQPKLQQRYWQRQVALIRRFYALLDTPVTEATMLTNSLFFGLQREYGLRDPMRPALSTAEVVRRFIDVANLEQFTEAQKQQQGIILIWMHSTANHWLRMLPWVDYMVGGVAGMLHRRQLDQPGLEELLLVRQLQVAQQRLQAGKVVGITPDGYAGKSSGLVRSFHRRQRVFRTGFADLAMLTNAPVLLVRAEMHPGQKVCFRFVGPLDTDGVGMGHAARVEHLMNQYLVHLDDLWRTRPWMIPWLQMEKHLSCPVGIETAV
jgi:acyl carrier protein